MKYNFSQLWSTQFFGFYEFKSLFEYASDKESQINYYKRLGAIQIDENGKSKVEPSQSLIDHRIDGNESALKMIKNQFIIFLFTRYEFIIQDTMKCLLCDNSERILKFIDVYPDYIKFIGFSLTEFVKCESKEEYVTIISERLSLKVLSGPPSKVIRRLKCLLNVEYSNVTVLDELMSKRNNIVHEGRIYEIELDELEVYYEAIDELLKVLALALKNINITVIDEGDFLTEKSSLIDYM